MTDALQGAPVSAQPETLADGLVRRKVIRRVPDNRPQLGRKSSNSFSLVRAVVYASISVPFVTYIDAPPL